MDIESSGNFKRKKITIYEKNYRSIELTTKGYGFEIGFM